MEADEIFEVKHHRQIILSMRKSVELYFNRCLKEKSCCQKTTNKWYSPRDKRMMKLYKKASSKIEEDLDVIRIIKHLKELNILTTHSMMNIFTRFQIDHANKNVLNLESADDNESSDFSSCAQRHDEYAEIDDYIKVECIKREF